MVKKQNESVSPEPGDRKLYKVIVIEDDEGLNRLIRKHLEREGFRTESALNGAEALSKICGTGDEVLLLDYMMPDMTAKEILSNLSQKQKRIPFIIMTGHGDEKIAVDMMKLGAIDYIVKEQNFMDILIPKIKRACAGIDIEQRLLKSEKSFRDLFDSITDLIYTQDLDGRFITVNHALAVLFGYEKDEFIGKPASDFMKPEMRPFFESGYLEQIKTKGSLEGITSYFAKNGDEIYIDYRSSLVKPDHGAPYITGTGRDVTEQVLSRKEIKRLQNQVHQSQKMEAIGLMAGGVAHDLNNILSGIVSYPELLLMDLPEGSPLRKPIKTIQESGMRAADVVADLLTVARGVATGREVANLNFQIKGYLNSAEHQQLADTHPSVTFKTEIDPDLLNISCSPTHIKKTLMNLVANASEAIEGSGAVTISTTNQYLDQPLKGYGDVRIGEYAVLTVSDDGSGITHGDLERIFEPFYTKKVMGRSGTGLGLAVVWNTVQDHGGYINVRSGDKGTVFELYLPVTRQTVVNEKEETPLEDYLGHGERILVVDDEERQREIACRMLTKLGYTAEAVSSGQEAIEYLKEKPVDLIVLDMVMPKGINGRETYEKIIKIHPGQKAVIASGFSETEEVKMAQKLGAGKYIKKPYILEKIGLAVREELEK